MRMGQTKTSYICSIFCVSDQVYGVNQEMLAHHHYCIPEDELLLVVEFPAVVAVVVGLAVESG